MDIDKMIFECLLILGVLLESFNGKINAPKKIVIILMVYILIKLIYYYINSIRIRDILLVGAVAFLFLVSRESLNENMYVLLYINIYELLGGFSKKWRLPCGVALCIYGGMAGIAEVKTQVFICSLTTLAIYYMEAADSNFLKSKSRIDSLEDEGYKLKIEKHKAQEKMKNIQKIAKIEERNIISQNLHDSIGHTIAGSLMQLQAVKMIVKDRRSEEILERVIEELKRGVDEIRTILRKMKPHENERGINLIRKMCMEMEDKGVKVLLDYKCSYDITVKVWEIINTNVKEAFTNILKYSSEREAVVEFVEMRGFIRIEIRNPAEGNTRLKKGLGLMGMEERLSEIDGKLIVDNTNGFSLIQIIPKEEK